MFCTFTVNYLLFFRNCKAPNSLYNVLKTEVPLRHGCSLTRLSTER